MNNSLEAAALARITEYVQPADNPVVLCSFGKDSIVTLHLTLRVRPGVPVIFLRHHKFQAQYEHAYAVARLWDLSVYDLMPAAVVDYQHDEYFEVLEFFSCGGPDKLILIDGIRRLRPDDTKYFCAVSDFLMRPKAAAAEYPWDCTVFGTKESDPSHLSGNFGPMQDMVQHTTTKFTFPIRDWTDADVWEYINTYDLPIDRRRYDDHVESVNPDKMPTCYACLEATPASTVWCPKFQQHIPTMQRTPAQHELTRTTILNSVKYCTPTGPGLHAAVT